MKKTHFFLITLFCYKVFIQQAEQGNRGRIIWCLSVQFRWIGAKKFFRSAGSNIKPIFWGVLILYRRCIMWRRLEKIEFFGRWYAYRETIFVHFIFWCSNTKQIDGHMLLEGVFFCLLFIFSWSNFCMKGL